ncbi:MAG TPA: ABC transporter ATP-binding protein, partial [Actinomycetota bacterium]
MGRHGRFLNPRLLDQEDPRPIRRATVRRVVATFRPYRAKVGLVAVAIAVTSGLGVVNPLLIKWIFDQGLFGNPPGSCADGACPDLDVVYLGVALMVAIPIVTGAIGIAQTYLANLVGLRVMQDLRNALYAHLQHMPLRFFTTTRTGEIQSRLSNDVGGVQSVVTDTASSILSNVVVIVSTLIAMLLLSVPLTILSLFMMPLFLYLTAKVGRARREVATSTQRTLADLTAVTEETLSVSGILLSKAFGRQRFEIGRFRTENERLTGLQIRQTMIGRSFFALVSTFFSITPALVYLVAGWLLSDGSDALTAGDIVAFTTLQSRLFFPIGSMLQVSTEVQSSFALFDRIFEYLDLEHEIVDAPDAIALDPAEVRGEVELDHVRFRYDTPPPDEAPVSPTDLVSGPA